MLSPPITPWTFTPALSVGCSTRSSFPGKLANQILQWLYREDRFCHVILTVLDRTVGPANIEIPMLALVISADEIAPLTSVAPFIDKVPVKDTRIINSPAKLACVCRIWARSSGVPPTHEYGRKPFAGSRHAVKSSGVRGERTDLAVLCAANPSLCVGSIKPASERTRCSSIPADYIRR
jgi:hypothetical protein